MGDERAAALEWADAARSRRVELGARLSSGDWDLARALAAADEEPLVGQIRLLFVLESLPGARKTDTRRALATLGLDPVLSLAQLGAADRELLVATFPLGARA